MNCRWNEDRAPVSTIVQPLRQKAFFPLMPLPFEPLIHFNPNVFRQKRERKLYLYQCATVLRLVQLHFVFVWLLFNSMSLPLLCIFFSLACSFCLNHCLLFIHFYPTNGRSLLLFVPLLFVYFFMCHIYLKRGRKK